MKDQPEQYPADHLDQFHRVSRFFQVSKRTAPEPYTPVNQGDIGQVTSRELLSGTIAADSASIYVHIPFCGRKCNFCDLYSFYIPKQDNRIIDEYCRAVHREIELMSKLFNNYRNVTTIHLGGGSPFFLSRNQLEGIVRSLRDHYPITPNTEIAVEISSSDICDENLDRFSFTGINRIHLGVQTFEDTIRQVIGRKEPGEQVKLKIEKLKAGDWVLSADMLLGLPMQSYSMFKDDFKQFIQTGIDGFSVYEMNFTKKMHKLMARDQLSYPCEYEKYFMFLYAWDELNQSGYTNNYFNHFANERDKSLYLTYPARGEDCLAFGAIADGKVGDLYYRNNKLKAYLDSLNNGELGFAFVFLEKKDRRSVRKVEEQLLSSEISMTLIENIHTTADINLNGIVDFWKYAGLIGVSHNNTLRITASGAWLMADMLKQLRRFG